MTAMSLGKDVSATEMMTLVARAKLATAGRREPRTLIEDIRRLTPHGLVLEYHTAVATLDALGLLTAREKAEVREYAEDYLNELPPPSAA